MPNEWGDEAVDATPAVATVPAATNQFGDAPITVAPAPAGTNEFGDAPIKFETTLGSDEENVYQGWKAAIAPHDSGEDYDFRGAFKAGVGPDESGHWPDTFKKPNHPTFSNESMYAKDRPDLAGHWEGEKFVPPANPFNQFDEELARDRRAKMRDAGIPIASEEELASRTARKQDIESHIGPIYHRMDRPLIGFGDREGEWATVPALPDMGSIPMPGSPLPSDVGAGVLNVVGRAASSLTSPENIGLMVGTAGTGKLVGRLISGGFGVKMLKDVYDSAPNAWRILHDPNATRQQKIEAVGDIGVTLVMGGTALKHAVAGGPVPAAGARPSVEPGAVAAEAATAAAPEAAAAPAELAPAMRDAPVYSKEEIARLTSKQLDDLVGRISRTTEHREAGSDKPLEPLPEGTQVEYLGQRYPVLEGMGEPVHHWQIQLPGEQGRGRTLTEDQLQAEGFQSPALPEETHAMASAGGGAGTITRLPAKAIGSLVPKQVSAFVDDLQRARAAVAPQTLGAPARYAANSLRELNAVMSNEMARADDSLRPFRREFDKTPLPSDWAYDPNQPLPRNLKFIDAYETGNTQNLPPLERAAAAEFARQNDDWISRVHALGTGAMQTLIENYFPHLWKDADRAKQVMGELLAKSPLEGSKSFMKQRTHKLFLDGLKAGLEPVHDNPVDLWMLKKREVERYILGQNFIKDMRTAGHLKFVHVFRQAPEGWSTVNDKAFTVNGPPSVKIEEAFDAGMRAKTYEALRRIGVPHERLQNLEGGAWGMAKYMRGVPGTEKIQSRFGGPDWAIWHELGHAIDNRYPEFRKTLFADPQARKELRVLADLRAEGQQVSPGFRDYLRSTPEKMAAVLQAYLHMPERMEQVAPKVKATLEDFMKVHPELQAIDEIRPTMTLGTAESKVDVGGIVKLGNYYLPDAAAKVVNNFLSPGLNRYAWYRSLREGSNLLNGVQLGVSAFHLGFTSYDAAVSRLALALEDAAHGDLSRAAKTAASVPWAPVTNFFRGDRLMKAVLDRPGGSQALQQLLPMVRSLEAAGGRVGQDAFWQTNFTRRMLRSFYEARQQLENGEWGGAISPAAKTLLRVPLAALEQTMRPILEYVVPRQKLGVFADMASREILRLGPKATKADTREAMRKAWDSVDNRMGQVVYDNLFFNRVVKDSALLAFRAFGWQLGKYREGVGALADTAAYAKEVARGRVGEFTHRMAYAMALPMMTAIVGGLLHHWMTGQRPQQARDLFQPQTGEKDANGNPVRLNLPSYVKDVIAYSKHPGTSFAHSLNPMASSMFDLLQNKDFYNTQIRDPDDPLWRQASDVAKFAAGEAKPFAVSGAMKLKENNAPAWKLVAPFFGFTPVPARQTMTPAQELAAETMAASLPSAPMTNAQFEQHQLMKDILRQIKENPGAGSRALADGIARGEINPDKATQLVEHLKYNPLQFQVHHMTAEAAMRVWRIANDQEKEQLRGIMAVKVLGAHALSPQQKRVMLKEIVVLPVATAPEK